MTQDETRKCLHCGEIKPLTAEHFQAIRFFVKKFSFFCIACDAESKTRKTRPEALEVDFIHGAKAGLTSAPLGGRHL